MAIPLYEVVRGVISVVVQGDVAFNGEFQIPGLQGPPGADGADGPRGITGPTGPTGVMGLPRFSFHHVQSTPASSWVVDHNLGYPVIQVVVLDTAGEEIEGEIRRLTSNRLVVDFNTAVSGELYVL